MSETEHSDKLIDVYTTAMSDAAIEAYYGGSKFHNLGYWNEETTSQADASRQLVEELLCATEIMPGRVADVACGLGATTQLIAERFGAENVTGVNLSPYQVARCRENFPALDFKVMNATDLVFPDNSLSAVISVEAAGHFNTRKKFFSESARVLQPGAKLVLCDIIYSGPLQPKHYWMSPPENTEYTIADYAAQVAAAGFINIEIRDITKQSWGTNPEKVRRWALTQHLYGNIDATGLRSLLRMSKLIKNLPVHAYIILSAEKG